MGFLLTLPSGWVVNLPLFRASVPGERVPLSLPAPNPLEVGVLGFLLQHLALKGHRATKIFFLILPMSSPSVDGSIN